MKFCSVRIYSTFNFLHFAKCESKARQAQTRIWIQIYKGAKLVGATGAHAPVVFIPRPEIIDICASLFVFLPEVLYIGAPLLFSPVWRQCVGLI